MRFRFKFNEEEDCYYISARRKSTGKWEVIGTCHAAAKEHVKNGRLELIQFSLANSGDR